MVANKGCYGYYLIQSSNNNNYDVKTKSLSSSTSARKGKGRKSQKIWKKMNISDQKIIKIIK